jgi:hypothetical protein
VHALGNGLAAFRDVKKRDFFVEPPGRGLRCALEAASSFLAIAQRIAKLMSIKLKAGP